ncbi:MAG: hypothetical protein HFI08_04785 [Bacilli bacterium]|nr:hypothetical protein [Bacilli bacterium]
MIESEIGLSYSFHLGNDKNKTKKARQSAKNNSSNTTSFSNNAIQNIKQLGKVNHHNLRKYDNNQELIKTIKGTNDIVKDVKDLYKQEFENAKIEYNNKQTRDDRKIKDYFYKISDDTKHDLACEIIIELGDKHFWKDKSQAEKYKMVEVFTEQVKDLENIVPEFKVANATIHFDESSPHLHIVGIAIKEDCKTGMTKQVGKTTVFTKESLKVIQDKMRECCINSYNNVYGLNEKLKEKQKGRNKDISLKDMEIFNETKNKLRENINELKIEIKDLEDTKNDISSEVNNLSNEKESITQEIDKKKSLNRKVILKDKATLLKENEELQEQLSYERNQHYLYENWYNDLKDKTDYLINNIKKVIDKVPTFIKTIVDRLFDSQGMNLKFFIQQYDEDYKMKQENERLKKINIFRKKQKYITPIENDVDYQLKENKKDRDDFGISR